MKMIDERSKKNLIGVHPNLVKVIEDAHEDSPINFIVIYGVRTLKEQQELYAQGRTKPGIKVTNCDGITTKSNHQVKKDGYGWAVDILADKNDNEKVDSVEINDVESLKIVAEHIKKTAQKLGISIEWGGDWKMRDYPHFELK